jgi:phosphonate ABC transporter permease subunit PhnE
VMQNASGETGPSTGGVDTDRRRGRPLTRALLVLTGIFAVLVVYSFAFEKTDVDLEEVKDPNRREQLVRIIRGLAQPDLIEFEEEKAFYPVEIATPCPADGFEPPAPDPSGPYLVVDPACADPESEVTVRGFNFEPGTKGPLSFIPPNQVVLKLANVETDQEGSFEVLVELPERPDEQVQQIRVTVTEQLGGWTDWTWTQTASDTGDKIIETVMLALMATTLGIAIGVPLSFFSARNLMRPIRSPLLSVALFLVGIPAGILAGRAVGRWITRFGTDHFLDEPLDVVIWLAGALLLGWLGMRWLLSTAADAEDSSTARLGRGLAWLILVGLGLMILLLTGYLLMEIGEEIKDFLDTHFSALAFLGGFFVNLGDVFTTFFTPLVAVIAALAGALGGSRLGHFLNDGLPKPIADMLRYPAGAAGVAVVAAGIGGGVNWLYDYRGANQAIAATAGAVLIGVTGGIVAARLVRPVRGRLPESVASFVIFTVAVAGILAGAALGVALGHLVDTVIGSVFDAGSILAAGLVGALLGIALAFATRRLDALPSGMITYYLSRSFFNAIRSVEPLIMAIVFVVWVGLGPFAGSLALALHTTAALAKLYSEQVESILPGPIEAVTATGATRLQNVIYAVVPQIVPPYIAFTLYRWDINVRMSTIIGFAGGGGVGFLLQQNINLLQYRAASVQMLAIAVVVSTLDFVSARVRERIV